MEVHAELPQWFSAHGVVLPRRRRWAMCADSFTWGKEHNGVELADAMCVTDYPAMPRTVSHHKESSAPYLNPVK